VESIKEYLKTVTLFSGLSEEVIDLLARTAEERHFPEGAKIVKKGEPGTSAFVLKEGVAETLLETATGAPVHLSKIGPGEVFGELALLDGEARSASVVATRDTTVLEIRRDLFLEEVAKHPKISLKLLSVVVKRLRRAESVVSDFAEKIYGDVLPRLEKTVSAQLDSAKTISEQSKERLAWISEKAEDSLAQAESLKAYLKWVVSIVGVLLTVAGGVAGFFGYQRYESFQVKWEQKWDAELGKRLDEVKNLESRTTELKEEAKRFVDDLKEDAQFLRTLRTSREAYEKLLVDELRQNLQLEGAAPVVSDEPPSDSFKEFFVSYRRLLRDVLGRPENWESVTLVNALELLAEIRRCNYVRLDEEEWVTVIGAIEQAVRHPPKHWLERRRLGDVVENLYELMIKANSPRTARALRENMENLLKLEKSEFLGREGEEQAALIAAGLDINPSQTSKILNELRKHESVWRRSQAAVTLITLGKYEGWRPSGRTLQVSSLNRRRKRRSNGGTEKRRLTQRQCVSPKSSCIRRRNGLEHAISISMS
jgi:CRP/FNR family cyclic AMP-dependent transcriptional regulator